jgi:MFS family permease
MFKSQQQYRTFLTVLMTYTLDLARFSIVFPVLAPLLLNPELHFFAVFAIVQFLGAPLAGALADHYGRYKIFNTFTIPVIKGALQM